MTDFGKIYRDVAYFGIWADDTADMNGATDALDVLRQAVEHSRDQDLRHDQAVTDALDFLAEQAGGAKRVAGFRSALDIPHPVTRRQALSAAYKALCRSAETSRHVE